MQRTILKWLIGLWVGIFVLQVWAASPAIKPAVSPDSLYPPDIAAIKDRGTLRLAMYAANTPPFFMRDEQGHWTGIDIELAERTAAALGVKLVVIPVPTYDGVINTVASGKADIGAGLISITPERALRVDFATPIYAYHPALLVNRLQLSKLGWNISDLITNLQTTNQPLRFGVLAASANRALLQGAVPSAQITSFQNNDALMQAVADGKIFAAMIDTPEQINVWLKAHPQAVLTTAEGVLTTRTVLFGVALSWKEPHLRNWLDVYVQDSAGLNIQQSVFQKYGVEYPGL